VTLAAAKAHLRADGADEDQEIEAQLRAATGHVERFTSHVLSPRAMEMVLDGFPELPELISIPREPVTAISSIVYADPATGADTAMEAGTWRWADTDADVVRPAFGAGWPRAAAETGSVRVRFSAGYEEGLAPPDLLEAVKRALVWLYDTRGAEAELPQGVRDLCAPFRRMLI
jgi:uncharacterized phiE125 gp8 family phage protein